MSTINIDTLETNPSSYWGIRVRKFIQNNPDDAMDRVKQALLNDAAAWSVFAALLMTVGFSALSISSGDFDHENIKNEMVAVLYVIFNSVSGGVCITVVISV